ncbi:MAG: hypothetical protein KGD73_02100 [Candidatus Lokiarchaeota archaeon]|nr:hypothetical protein [Candidatus Lokiarchaeota archaeon]
MIFFKSYNKYSTKLRTFKSDIAPVGFYFDIFPTEVFQIPILPIPMRIDKLTNGKPTLFIIPNREKLEKLSNRLNLSINFNLFYTIGVKNFIGYARLKQKEITLRHLDDDKIRKWWNASINISAFNPDLVESFTYINSQFLKCFFHIDKNNLDPFQDRDDYKNILIHYCDSIIKYFRKKIERNIFFIKKGNKIEIEKLYLENNQKYYPLVIKMPVNDLTTNKTHEMGFVPYLIYDDLLDSFYYNKKTLEDADSIDLKVYQHNEIINIRSTIENNRTNSNEKNLKDLNLEQILQKLNIY